MSIAWCRARAHVLVPVAIYLVLVLLGITTSNIGVDALREDPSSPIGIQLGSANPIRSDEYNTDSPLWLGQIAVGPGDPLNPLSVSPDFFSQLPDGPFSSVVFFDGTLLMLGPWLPDAMLFAAKWWLPTLLLAVGMPIWFRQITGSLRWGYLAAALIAFSPSNAWWSGWPVNTLGFIAAACALGVWGVLRVEEGRRGAGVLAIVGAGVLLARFPTYYQPLAIMVGFPVVLATVCFLLTREVRWRVRLAGVGAIGLSGLLWSAGLWLENLEAITAGLTTVYPGQRESSSESLIVGRMFGATNLGWLRTVGTELPNGGNQSELASSFAVLIAVVVLMLAAQRWRGSRALTSAFVPVAALAVFWLCWGTVYLGSVGAALPLVNRVPGFRASLGAGFIAILALALALPQWQTQRDWRVPAVAGGVAAFLSAWGGSSLQLSYLPLLTGRMIWVSALVTGAVVAVLVKAPRHRIAVPLTSAAALLLVFNANPVLVGLGDLRASDSARYFLDAGATARAEATVWAGDSAYVDALWFATGTPALSSRQRIGPDSAQWLRLDPGGTHEDVWNRGGSYIWFSWTDEPGLAFSNPTPDVVLLTGSPCTVAERMPELAHISSGQELSAPCLDPAGTFQWSGVTHYIYDVHPTSDGA